LVSQSLKRIIHQKMSILPLFTPPSYQSKNVNLNFILKIPEREMLRNVLVHAVIMNRDWSFQASKKYLKSSNVYISSLLKVCDKFV